MSDSDLEWQVWMGKAEKEHLGRIFWKVWRQGRSASGYTNSWFDAFETARLHMGRMMLSKEQE
jgi:hypothetical protein